MSRPPLRKLGGPRPTWPESPDVLWDAFEHHALPATAPREQRVEMRKAFVSGLFSMLGEMRRVPDGDDDEQADSLEAYWQDLTRRMAAMSPAR
jgi:hypothetical protein